MGATRHELRDSALRGRARARMAELSWCRAFVHFCIAPLSTRTARAPPPAKSPIERVGLHALLLPGIFLRRPPLSSPRHASLLCERHCHTFAYTRTHGRAPRRPTPGAGVGRHLPADRRPAVLAGARARTPAPSVPALGPLAPLFTHAAPPPRRAGCSGAAQQQATGLLVCEQAAGGGESVPRRSAQAPSGSIQRNVTTRAPPRRPPTPPPALTRPTLFAIRRRF